MRIPPRLVISWLWAALIAAAAIAGGIAVGNRDGLSVDVFLLPVVGVLYAVLGLLIVVRRPGNGVAWLFFVVATWVALTGANVLILGDESVAPDPASIWHLMALAWGNSGYFVALFVPVFLFFYLFPTGRYMTRRWARAGWAGALLTVMAFPDAVLQREIGPEDADWTISNPVGFLETNSPILQGATALGLLLLVVGGVLAIIIRYRRSDVEVRSQIKWVLFGLGVMLACFFGSWVEGTPDWLSSLLFVGLLSAIPVSVMVAITRYRLYDIDRLVSRTVGYVIVISLLALMYVTGAVWLPSRLIGEQSPVFVAASTLAAAALFNPLRKKVVEAVDRRFNRSSYDHEQVIEHFSHVIDGLSDVGSLIENTTSVVTEALQPATIGLWVRQENTATRT